MDGFNQTVKLGKGGGSLRTVEKERWFDCRGLNEAECHELLPLALNAGYDGLMMTLNQSALATMVPAHCKMLLELDRDVHDGEVIIRAMVHREQTVIVSANEDVLKAFPEMKKGLILRVSDAESLGRAARLAGVYDYAIIELTAETNIPLELILAFSQNQRAKVCKQVTHADDGWVAGMVMEMGSYAVLLKTRQPEEILALRDRMAGLASEQLPLEELAIVETRHIGMGDRVCIDTTSDLGPDEGMIIGSTSSGGLLMSSETHFLPYMELRPFRVNAGALHSYIWCAKGETRYLSELKAGDPVLAVTAQGNTRILTVGRIKMERRPLLLIRAVSSQGVQVNTIIQDDWHVRLLGPQGEVRNSTKLGPDDKILGLLDAPGRHVGIAIEERIVEK
jgi:3-amino-4-hydroxybenzoic acid synthase